MGAFEFKMEPQDVLVHVTDPNGCPVWFECKSVGNADFDRLMRICELVETMQECLAVASNIHPSNRICGLVAEASSLLKGAHE